MLGPWTGAESRCCAQVQVSNDVRMLLPLLVGILAAKWVADAATHSLYHGLLEVCLYPSAFIHGVHALPPCPS